MSLILLVCVFKLFDRPSNEGGVNNVGVFYIIRLPFAFSCLPILYTRKHTVALLLLFPAGPLAQGN